MTHFGSDFLYAVFVFRRKKENKGFYFIIATKNNDF
jgi:hypothetical protein